MRQVPYVPQMWHLRCREAGPGEACGWEMTAAHPELVSGASRTNWCFVFRVCGFRECGP